MTSTLNSTIHHNKIQCVPAPDKIGCIDLIIKGFADWTILAPEELHVAQRYLPKSLVVTSEIRSADYPTRDHRYGAVAVIRKSSGITSIVDLKGKRSCHTGFGKTAGWRVPFSGLFSNRQLNCRHLNDTRVSSGATSQERDLAVIANYFQQACLPGSWAPDTDADSALKAKYPELCQLCNNPSSCDKNDNHAGYEGALKCLVETGDIAWTKWDAVQEYFQLRNTEEAPLSNTADFELLCADGSRMSLSSANSDNPCTWAKRPWSTIVASSRLASNNLTVIRDLQAQLTELQQKGQTSHPNGVPPPPQWLGKVLEFYKPDTDLVYHHSLDKVKSLTPQAYLDPTSYSNTLWHPSCGIMEDPLRLCVFNELQLQKCNVFRLAALGQRISPGFSCELGYCVGHCAMLVARGKADLVVAEGHQLQSNRLNGLLTPILTEVEPTGVPYRYALAVIRSEISEEFGQQGNLSALRGKSSCHGDVKSVAGWNAPLSVLRDEGEIEGEPENNCDLAGKLFEYFGKSCVPGHKDGLCGARASDSKRYQGSLGALRCLEDAVADVAFTDNVALSAFDNDNVQLLCRNGTVTSLENFKDCHWGLVMPQRVFARAGENDTVLRENARLSLLRAQEIFKTGGKQESVFKMFGGYYGNKNVIFQDTSLGLRNEVVGQGQGQEGQGRDVEEKLVKDFQSCGWNKVGIPGGPHHNF